LVADFERRHLRREGIEEIRVDAAGGQHALGGDAHLPGISVAGGGHGRRHLLGAIAAKLVFPEVLELGGQLHARAAGPHETEGEEPSPPVGIPLEVGPLEHLQERWLRSPTVSLRLLRVNAVSAAPSTPKKFVVLPSAMTR